MDFTHTRFWVQAHGLPFRKLTKSFAAEISLKVGTLIDVDCDVDGFQLDRSFLHFKVKVNLRRPLCPRFMLPRDGYDDLWINFKYERLGDFCYNCGRLGHDVDSCGFECDSAISRIEVGLRTSRFISPPSSQHGYIPSQDTTTQPHTPPSSSYYYVDPIGRSGGLALWRKNSLSFDVVNGDKNLILVNGSCTIPSTSAKDKQGGSLYTSRSVDEFQAFLNASELFEIPYKRLSYTWDNKRDVGASIHERIDRALSNDVLLETFSFHTLIHHHLIGSDHTPLLYNTCPTKRKTRKCFRFESMWTTDEACKDTIQKSWVHSRESDHI
nr:reverse transcriptase [Tanacetum cinerariifolium]